jgi:hypothetical protein
MQIISAAVEVDASTSWSMIEPCARVHTRASARSFETGAFWAEGMRAAAQAVLCSHARPAVQRLPTSKAGQMKWEFCIKEQSLVLSDGENQ